MKTLQFDTTLVLWRLYLKNNFHLYDQFMKYVEAIPQNKKKGFSPDTWRMVLEFDEKVKGDLGNYREEDGWPLFLD